MLNEYIRLNKEYNELYDKWMKVSDLITEQETKILKEFGLPNVWKYYHPIRRLINYSNPEQEFNNLIVTLHKMGIEYAKSDPKSNLKILRDAKFEGTSSNKILPEIGVFNSSYAEFIYDDVFLNGRENEKNSLEILKKANSYEDLESLLFHYQRMRELRKNINKNEIPYFNEYLKYDPYQEEEPGELEKFFKAGFEINSENSFNRDSYREHLNNTSDVLDDLGQQLFTCLINIAMNGELNSADEFEIGEVVNFKESDFRNLDDQNAQLIIKILDMISKTHSILININKLDVDKNDDNTPF